MGLKEPMTPMKSKHACIEYEIQGFIVAANEIQACMYCNLDHIYSQSPVKLNKETIL